MLNVSLQSVSSAYEIAKSIYFFLPPIVEYSELFIILVSEKNVESECDFELEFPTAIPTRMSLKYLSSPIIVPRPSKL